MMLTPRWVGEQREKWRRRKERAVRALFTLLAVSAMVLGGLVALALYLAPQGPRHNTARASSATPDTITRKPEQRAGGPGKPCGDSYIAADKTCHK